MESVAPARNLSDLLNLLGAHSGLQNTHHVRSGERFCRPNYYWLLGWTPNGSPKNRSIIADQVKQNINTRTDRLLKFLFCSR